MFTKTLAALQRVENLIIIGAFLAMVGAFFLQVLNRNFFQVSMPWLEEIAVFSMIYLALLGTEAGLRDGSQVALTGFVDRFSGWRKLSLQVLAKVVVVIFSIAMLYASLNVVLQQISSGQTSSALGAPMWFPFGAFLLAFAIIVPVQIAALIALFRHRSSGDDEPAGSAGVPLPEGPHIIEKASEPGVTDPGDASPHQGEEPR